jgi:hypothetical protein
LNLTQVTQAKEQEIVNLTQVSEAKEQEIVNLTQVSEAKEQEINEILNSTCWKITLPIRIIGSLKQTLTTRNNEIKKIINSKSFFITKPLRFLRKVLRGEYSFAFNFLTKLNFSQKILIETNVKTLGNKKDLHICFYLPQFHEIEENNKFWGKGFTEWTNVKKTKPLFEGHDQPKVPHKSLGYYDLLEKDSLVKQVNLATSYGIDAFCFYTYLFDKDKVLLDKPLNLLLNNLDINQKFCICWANENWTRTWDGEDKERLIEQIYSEELLNFFPEYIEKFVTDKRYVRDHNRPLILIYRPEKIPNISYWSDQWRNYFRKKLNIEILLCKVNSFSFQSAADINFDFNIEFPPNMSGLNKIKKNIYPKTLNIFDYNAFLNEEYHIKKNQKLLIRSTFPSWDNTPRRQENGTVFLNTNPAKFYQYIELCKKFRPEIKNLKNNYLFINSWNEWAEGAHIEPDNFNGFNNLTSNKISKKKQKKILFFIHDLHPHGTQYQTLAMAEFYKKYGYLVEVITFENGKLEEIFREKVDAIDILDIKKKVHVSILLKIL